MLAELAVGAGYVVVAFDRFGDLDLRRLCPSVSVLRDLGGRGGMAALVDAAEEIRAPSVVYGAGLENQPALVARLAAGRRLLGCRPETLQRVRDTAVLGASLRSAGLAYPSTFSAADAPRRAERSRRWLRKPVRGGGGRGVREWRGGALAGDVVVQERISGLACSAAAVANGRSAVVLGLSEQLVGHRALGGRGYAWCGNVVPPRLGEAQRRRADRTRRRRSARIWRRRSNCAGCSASTSCGTASARGSSRSTPARRGRSSPSRRRTRWASSPPTWTVAPGACRRSLPLRPAPGGGQGDSVRHPRRARRRHPRLAGARHPRRASPG